MKSFCLSFPRVFIISPSHNILNYSIWYSTEIKKIDGAIFLKQKIVVVKNVIYWNVTKIQPWLGNLPKNSNQFSLTLFKFRSFFNLFQIKRIIQYRLASIDSNAWRHLCAQLYNNFKFYSGDNYKKFFFLHFCSISSPHTRTIENECVWVVQLWYGLRQLSKKSIST